MRLIRAKDYQDMSRKAVNIISVQVIMKSMEWQLRRNRDVNVIIS